MKNICIFAICSLHLQENQTMKKKIIIMGITLLVIFACFLIYWAGYTNGYNTAGYKYYYDGMKVDYAFKKVKANFDEMRELMENITPINYGDK